MHLFDALKLLRNMLSTSIQPTKLHLSSALRLRYYGRGQGGVEDIILLHLPSALRLLCYTNHLTKEWRAWMLHLSDALKLPCDPAFLAGKKWTDHVASVRCTETTLRRRFCRVVENQEGCICSMHLNYVAVTCCSLTRCAYSTHCNCLAAKSEAHVRCIFSMHFNQSAIQQTKTNANGGCICSMHSYGFGTGCCCCAYPAH